MGQQSGGERAEYRETRESFARKEQVIKMAENISYEKQWDCESVLTRFSAAFLLLVGCVTLGHIIYLFGSQFPVYKMRALLEVS